MGLSVKLDAVALASDITNNFYDLSKAIVRLYDEDRSDFRDLWEQGHVKRRTLYHLNDVGKFLEIMEVGRERADEIGWTKIQIVMRHFVNVPTSHVNELESYLDIARDTKARDLQSALNDGASQETRAEVFYLTTDERSLVWKALEKFGAKRKGQILKGKKLALLQLAENALTTK